MKKKESFSIPHTGVVRVNVPLSVYVKNCPFHIYKYLYDDIEDLVYHSHDYIEIALVYKGTGLHYIDGKVMEVVRGDIFIINTGTPHCFYPPDNMNSTHLSVLNCMFDRSFLSDLSRICPLIEDILNLFSSHNENSNNFLHSSSYKINSADSTAIADLIESLWKEYADKSEGFLDMEKFMVCELLILIYRALHKPFKSNSDIHSTVSKAIKYIEKNYNQPLDLEIICKNIFASKGYLCKLFKEDIGISPIQYLNQYRIDKSCELLKNSDCKITDIPLLIGYDNYNQFSQNFLKITGMCARKYKQAIDKLKFE